MDYLFSEYDSWVLFQNQTKVAEDEVDRLDEDYLLNVSEADLVAALTRKLQWNSPQIEEPQIASHREVVQERSHLDYGSRHCYSVRVNEIIVHIPYSGDKDLFRVCPPNSNLNPPRANLRSDCLEIVLECQSSEADKIRELIDKFVCALRFFLDQLERLAQQNNERLPNLIEQHIHARKSRILNRRNLVANLGFQLRHRDDSSQTYAAPAVRRKPDVKMPHAGHKPFVPEPILAESEYENILTIMRSMVRVMESSPHAFAMMKEEDLRQHFLVQLNGQYQGGATGETFNYEGKTDILIREKERNVFIGECKFWKGPESLTKTIDQCLGYLHWRDTKAAIVMFNRNKDFSNVLAQIEPTAKAHPGFKRVVRQVCETEWRFIFANKDDSNREVHLAIMAFDIPKTK